MMGWPRPDPSATQPPYRARTLYPAARWQDDEPPLPVSKVPEKAGYHPRRSQGISRHAPGASLDDARPFYYCRSCNRLVENPNIGFCAKHRQPRSRFMRRRRDASVPVPRRITVALTAAQAAVAAAWERYIDAPLGSTAANHAWRDLDDAINTLAPLAAEVARIEPAVRTDDLDDDDYRIN